MKDIILFTSANNETQIEVQFEKETVLAITKSNNPNFSAG